MFAMYASDDSSDDSTICAERIEDLWDCSVWSEYTYNQRETFRWIDWMFQHNLMVFAA